MNKRTNELKELVCQQIIEVVQNLCPCSAPAFPVIVHSMYSSKMRGHMKRNR